MNKYVRLRGWPYIHTCRSFAWPARTSRREITNCKIHRPSRADRFVRFGAFGGAKFPKMCYFLLWTPMNRRAKFDAASFILGKEIRNRTNKHTHTHTHTHKTVTDISTPCLSACVDSNLHNSCKIYNFSYFTLTVFNCGSCILQCIRSNWFCTTFTESRPMFFTGYDQNFVFKNSISLYYYN